MRSRIGGLLLLAFFCSSCAPGFLYTDITVPLTENMYCNQTEVLKVKGNTQELKEPFTAAGIRAEWASYAIGDVAKQNDLQVVSFADERIFSILGGLYRSRTVMVNGTMGQEELPSDYHCPSRIRNSSTAQ